MNFGIHLTIDGYGGNYGLLNQDDNIKWLIHRIIEIENMRLLKFGIVKAEDNQLKDPGGWSAFAIIAESHIAVHTFPARGFVSADIYTCGDSLNKDQIIGMFEGLFDLNKVETNLIKRGTEYPNENILKPDSLESGARKDKEII